MLALPAPGRDDDYKKVPALNDSRAGPEITTTTREYIQANGEHIQSCVNAVLDEFEQRPI